MGESLGLEAYRALYEHCPDGVFFTIPDGTILAANHAACDMLRMTEPEIRSRGRQGLSDPADDRWATMLHERERNGSVRGVARMVRSDGELIEIELSAQCFPGERGELRAVTIVRDVTERVQMERRLVQMSTELRELALTDELTGLRNRRGLLNAGSHLLELADRQRSTLQLLLLDVDSMKQLNDRFGHVAGDRALQAVARSLARSLRHADLVSRIGGDEFVTLAIDLESGARDAVEERVREHLRAPVTVAQVGRPVEVSIGWSERAPLERTTIEDLLAHADRVMYEAKTTKRG
ncbi:MAG: sensor domain-containing diguanylate cyclase [Actinomycetota bacterium]|nr:sensor domain-containing diguanylate cyclase [Actinomycetota bacterium]